MAPASNADSPAWQPLPLTEANRRLLDQAYRNATRVDLAIDCAVEGTMGRAYTDDLASPSIFLVESGPFLYFAGNAEAWHAPALIRSLEGGFTIMPTFTDWHSLLTGALGERAIVDARYRLDSGQVTHHAIAPYLRPPSRDIRIELIDRQRAAQLESDPDAYFDLSVFASPFVFCALKMGFVALRGEQVAGAAWASLVCRRGIEMSAFVSERFRQQGIGTVLCAHLVDAALNRGLEPHWDAANRESIRMGAKLGYRLAGAYESLSIAGQPSETGILGT